jgi:hypothetical protein
VSPNLGIVSSTDIGLNTPRADRRKNWVCYV